MRQYLYGHLLTKLQIDFFLKFLTKGNHSLSIYSKPSKFKCKTDIDYPSLLAGGQPATG